MCLAFTAAIQKCLSFPLIHRLHIYLHEIVIPFIRKGGQLTLPHPYKNFIQTTISIYRSGNQKLGKYFFLGHIFSFEDSRLGLEMFCLQRLPSLLISLSLSLPAATSQWASIYMFSSHTFEDLPPGSKAPDSWSHLSGGLAL